jgi:hypothetical protein
MSPVGTRRSRATGFIGGAIVTLIAMTLTARARRSAGPAGNLRDPEPEASDETSSPRREVEQSFWNKHAGPLLGLAGALAVAVITAAVAIVGTLSNTWQQERSGQQQYQSDLVLRALEPDDADEREEQLRFLLDTRLLTDEEIREGLTAYLSGRNDLPQFARSLRVAGEAAQAAQAFLRLSCHPSYNPCVPNASDVDCLGSSDDGPAYADRVKVVGPDVYGLDPDGDGMGCE